MQHVASQKAEAYGKKDRREVVDISFSEKGRVSENKNFEDSGCALVTCHGIKILTGSLFAKVS